MSVFNNILELIGKTPVVQIRCLTNAEDATVYGKLERFNPGGSVKDRIALSMILASEKEGKIRPGDTLVEPTSGNTGIGLAMVATVRGYHMILTMPDTMSFERRALLEFLGAEIALTPGELGMQGAIDLAETMASEKGYHLLYQFSNRANPQIHAETTAIEIIEDFKDLGLDYFVAGVGTGGTISGVGKVLKQAFPGLQVIAVEPKASPVLSGGSPGYHGIQGIGAGFIPKNYHAEVIDQIIAVSDEDAIETARKIAKFEGVMVGISAGASAYAAFQLSKKAGQHKKILVILPDGAEHYMTTALFKRGY